ncbi:DedA family protein [Mariniluteicoccus endophyticus]
MTDDEAARPAEDAWEPTNAELPADPDRADPDRADGGEPDEKPWWDDPNLPWSKEPTRADMTCFWLIAALGVYGMALLPFRAVLITRPYLAACLTGSRTGVVMIGALAATHHDVRWLPMWWLFATLSVMKFDPVYFWAGKLWGRGVFEMVAGRSPRARRNAERAERFAHRYEVPAILVTYLPIPLPAAVVYATVGAAGMTWRRFLTANFAFAGMLQAIYMYLGYRIGEPAVKVVAEYGRWAWYVSLAIIVVMIGSYVVSQRRRAREGADA